MRPGGRVVEGAADHVNAVRWPSWRPETLTLDAKPAGVGRRRPSRQAGEGWGELALFLPDRGPTAGFAEGPTHPAGRSGRSPRPPG